MEKKHRVTRSKNFVEQPSPADGEAIRFSALYEELRRTRAEREALRRALVALSQFKMPADALDVILDALHKLAR
jgi:hypothetical protein